MQIHNLLELVQLSGQFADIRPDEVGRTPCTVGALHKLCSQNDRFELHTGQLQHN